MKCLLKSSNKHNNFVMILLYPLLNWYPSYPIPCSPRRFHSRPCPSDFNPSLKWNKAWMKVDDFGSNLMKWWMELNKMFQQRKLFSIDLEYIGGYVFSVIITRLRWVALLVISGFGMNGIRVGWGKEHIYGTNNYSSIVAILVATAELIVTPSCVKLGHVHTIKPL